MFSVACSDKWKTHNSGHAELKIQVKNAEAPSIAKFWLVNIHDIIYLSNFECFWMSTKQKSVILYVKFLKHNDSRNESSNIFLNY